MVLNQNGVEGECYPLGEKVFTIGRCVSSRHACPGSPGIDGAARPAHAHHRHNTHGDDHSHDEGSCPSSLSARCPLGRCPGTMRNDARAVEGGG